MHKFIIFNYILPFFARDYRGVNLVKLATNNERYCWQLLYTLETSYLTPQKLAYALNKKESNKFLHLLISSYFDQLLFYSGEFFFFLVLFSFVHLERPAWLAAKLIAGWISFSNSDKFRPINCLANWGHWRIYSQGFSISL